MDGPLVVDDRLTLPGGELGWRFSRASGPGGQGINTTDSRVQLTWTPATSPALAGLGEELRTRLLTRVSAQLLGGSLVVTAAEHREQLRNRDAARDRLAGLLRAALAPPPPRRRSSRPTRGAVERRLRSKRARASVKAGRARPAPE